MTSVAPNRRAASIRCGWMSITTIREAPAIRAPLTALRPTPPAPKDHNRVAEPHIRRVQDGASARDDAAPEQGRLHEGHFLRHDRELVFVEQEVGVTEA